MSIHRMRKKKKILHSKLDIMILLKILTLSPPSSPFLQGSASVDIDAVEHVTHCVSWLLFILPLVFGGYHGGGRVGKYNALSENLLRW